MTVCLEQLGHPAYSGWVGQPESSCHTVSNIAEQISRWYADRISLAPLAIKVDGGGEGAALQENLPAVGSSSNSSIAACGWVGRVRARFIVGGWNSREALLAAFAGQLAGFADSSISFNFLVGCRDM
jgi:hypothetical protein